MTDYSDETLRWKAAAECGDEPFGFVYDNGTLILSVVRDPGPTLEICDRIADRGVVYLRAVDCMRARDLTLSSRSVHSRTQLDSLEPNVQNGIHSVRLKLPEPHPDMRLHRERNVSCRFFVTNSGCEEIETHASGIERPVASSFFADSTEQSAKATPPLGRCPDVLVVVALKDERDAFIRVLQRSHAATWAISKDSTNLEFHHSTIVDPTGHPRLVVLARAYEMGETASANRATTLIADLGAPSILAMSGICAGHPTRSRLGDVIIANRLFKFDSGKREVVKNTATGEREETVFCDISTHLLDPPLQVALEDFAPEWNCTVPSFRPKSYEHQLRWLLWTLYTDPSERSEPLRHPERAAECNAWARVVEAALKGQWVTVAPKLRLTTLGRERVEQERTIYGEVRPTDPTSPTAHVGPMGTSAMVQQDADLFSALQRMLRTIVGVDMEAAAVGAVARERDIPFLVAKGVVDYADMQKNDNFRVYAAEASACFVIEFLMKRGGSVGLWKDR